MAEFGLTAKARTKLPKLENADTDDSPLMQFIKDSKEIR